MIILEATPLVAARNKMGAFMLGAQASSPAGFVTSDSAEAGRRGRLRSQHKRPD